uniref:sn-1-specific diacylglycerol lipase ABHD11-like isoform X2 n=1 Tax=Myxine glutinosa TaxID=7769 RepID=UPI00358F1518
MWRRPVLALRTVTTFSTPCTSPLPLSHVILSPGETPEKPPVVFMHGLFGNKNNFTFVGKHLGKLTGRKVVSVDLRNHGDSGHGDATGWREMASDIKNLLEQERLVPTGCLIGHSMGGKVAMVTTLLWNIAIRNFLLTNLIERDGRVQLRVNLPVLSAHLNDLLGFPDDLSQTYEGPTLFLGGSQSPYISPSTFPSIFQHFPKASISHIPGAGHWLHADQPQAFVQAVSNFLKPTTFPLWE